MDQDAQRGLRLKEERKRLGLSQQLIADSAGVSREMWARYEAGAEPGANALTGAAACGLDVYYALTGQRSGGATVLTARETSLVENYRVAPEEAKKAFETTLAYVVNAPHEPKKLRGKSLSGAQSQTSISVAENHGQVIEGGQINHGPVTFGSGKTTQK